MKSSVIAYAVVLAAALGGAYWTWTEPPQPGAESGVVLFAGEPEQLERVLYESPKLEVVLSDRHDERGRYTWVEVEPKGEQPETEQPRNPHMPAPLGGPAQFKAGKGAESLLEQLAPFTVRRSLTGLDDDKLAELGLDDPDSTLTLTRAGREPKTFQLAESPFGGSTVYVRDPESGTVYVADDGFLRSLESATQALRDPFVLAVTPREVQRVRVVRGDDEVAFEHRNPDDPRAEYWSVAGDDAKNPTAATWLDKALGLRVKEYVAEGSEPAGLSAAFRYTAVARGEDPTTVVVYRAPPEASTSESGDQPAQERWYARSEHTRALVELDNRGGGAAQAVAELDALFSSAQ